MTVGPNLTVNGGFDAFVAKVNPSGTVLDYAGYIGGSGDGLWLESWRGFSESGAVGLAGRAFSSNTHRPRPALVAVR